MRQIPRWLFAFISVVLPAVIIYKLGENAIPFLLACTGIFIAFLIQKSRYFPHLYLAFFASFLCSVELPLPGGAAIFAPAEPLVLLLGVSTFFAAFKHLPFLKRAIQQPLFWAIALFAFALVFSAAFSTIPLVSAKYVFIVLALLAVGVFTLPLLLQNRAFTFQTLLKWLAIPVLFFALLAVYNLLPYRFNPGAAALIGQPFFKDHTVFSATFSMLVPLFLLWPTWQKEKNNSTFYMPAIGLAMCFALFVSSSRGAWLALLLTGLFYAFVKAGGTAKWFATLTLLFAFLVIFNLDYLEKKLPVNPYNSTDAGNDLTSQALSVTNINTDVSNLERLNRWNSALKMGAEKPLFGFGPGTYQFLYFPYQADADKTYISVDSPFNNVIGRGGSAHSEYLLLFSESGVLGLVSWIAIQVALVFTFFKIWVGRLTREEKNLALALFLGTFTFTIHSLFNNYLNAAQFGIVWWTLVGMLLFLTLKNQEKHDAAH